MTIEQIIALSTTAGTLIGGLGGKALDLFVKWHQKSQDAKKRAQEGEKTDLEIDDLLEKRNQQRVKFLMDESDQWQQMYEAEKKVSASYKKLADETEKRLNTREDECDKKIADLERKVNELTERISRIILTNSLTDK